MQYNERFVAFHNDELSPEPGDLAMAVLPGEMKGWEVVPSPGEMRRRRAHASLMTMLQKKDINLFRHFMKRFIGHVYAWNVIVDAACYGGNVRGGRRNCERFWTEAIRVMLEFDSGFPGPDTPEDAYGEPCHLSKIARHKGLRGVLREAIDVCVKRRHVHEVTSTFIQSLNSGDVGAIDAFLAAGVHLATTWERVHVRVEPRVFPYLDHITGASIDRSTLGAWFQTYGIHTDGAFVKNQAALDNVDAIEELSAHGYKYEGKLGEFCVIVTHARSKRMVDTLARLGYATYICSPLHSICPQRPLNHVVTTDRDAVIAMIDIGIYGDKPCYHISAALEEAIVRRDAYLIDRLIAASANAEYSTIVATPYPAMAIIAAYPDSGPHGRLTYAVDFFVGFWRTCAHVHCFCHPTGPPALQALLNNGFLPTLAMDSLFYEVEGGTHEMCTSRSRQAVKMVLERIAAELRSTECISRNFPDELTDLVVSILCPPPFIKHYC